MVFKFKQPQCLDSEYFWTKFGVFKDATQFYPLRTNRCVRSDFCGATVQVALIGQEVSFNTTDDANWHSPNSVDKSQERVGFRRGYRAGGLMLFCSVVLHDSWCVGIN